MSFCRLTPGVAGPNFANSSTITALKRKSSTPPPPYCSGMLNPIRPYLPAATYDSRSTRRSLSHFSTFGAHSFSRNWRAVSRNCSCSASNTSRFISLLSREQTPKPLFRREIGGFHVCSACFPHRLTFFRERQRSFLGVLGAHQCSDLTHGPRPAGLVAGDHPVVDTHGHPLAGPHRQGCVAGNPFRESQCGVDRGAVGHHLIDQPPLQRVGRGHRFTGEDQLHRDLAR